jgi:hypothetical protein
MSFDRKSEIRRIVEEVIAERSGDSQNQNISHENRAHSNSRDQASEATHPRVETQTRLGMYVVLKFFYLNRV